MKNNAPLPSFVVYSIVENEFTIFTTDESLKGEYVIILKGSSIDDYGSYIVGIVEITIKMKVNSAPYFGDKLLN